MSTEHVKGLAVVFQLQTGRAKLHSFGTKAKCNFKIMAFFFWYCLAILLKTLTLMSWQSVTASILNLSTFPSLPDSYIICLPLPLLRLRISCAIWTHQASDWEISGFCHKVEENCTLLGYYTVGSGNSWPTFWDNLWILTHDDGSNRLSWNVGKEWPLLAV